MQRKFRANTNSVELSQFLFAIEGSLVQIVNTTARNWTLKSMLHVIGHLIKIQKRV